jgi:hypothetical protein
METAMVSGGEIRKIEKTDFLDAIPYEPTGPIEKIPAGGRTTASGGESQRDDRA